MRSTARTLSALGEVGGELHAIYHIDTCAADGIAVVTGCLPEEGRLTVNNVGRHRLELWGAAGCGVRAELTVAALARAAVCRKRLDEGGNADEVLAVLRSAPADELIALTPLAGEEADA